jgi:type VI protein secretion system component VasK
MRRSNDEFCTSMDDRGRALWYLGLVLLSLVVWLVGQWTVATYDPLDYGTSALVGLLILTFEIVGLYAAFRMYQLRHPQ